MNDSTVSSSHSARRLRLLIGLLLLLCVVGVVRTLRSRWYLERRLSQMSPPQLDAWTRDHPDDAIAFHYLGMARHRAIQMQPAAEAYSRALELDPTLSRTRTKLAGVLMHAGRAQAAEALLEQGIQIDPAFSELHMGLGQIREGRQDFRRAAQAWEKAAALEPGDAIAWFHLGNCHLSLNDHARALPAYEKAAGLDPLQPDYQIALASALRLAARLPEAEEHCRRALVLRPGDPVSTFELMKILRDRGNAGAEVESLMRKTVELAPDDPQYRYYLATILQEQGKLAEAVAAYTKAETMYVKSPPRGLSAHWNAWGLWLSHREGIHFNRARLYKRLGRGAEATKEMALYDRLSAYHQKANHLYGIAANKPRDPSLRFELARVHEAAGFSALAREQREMGQRLRDGKP